MRKVSRKSTLHDKTDLKAFNDLQKLPPIRENVETVKVLRQLVKSSIALAELKGLAFTLPNPAILLNAVVLKEARASSEIENVVRHADTVTS
ncbi:MAG: Fic/DOC family N-terminal domain-containing protein [Cyclobacteriaceae bacterium]